MPTKLAGNISCRDVYTRYRDRPRTASGGPLSDSAAPFGQVSPLLMFDFDFAKRFAAALLAGLGIAGLLMSLHWLGLLAPRP